MKNIVICADGTWNDPTDEQPTNILQIARGIAPVSGNTRQVVFYDWGVGSYYSKVGGSVSGVGLEKNIMDCYRFIVHNYEPGDRLYFFGFSRGSFTVRSLGGFIRNCGIIKPGREHLIEHAFHKIYKNRRKDQRPTAPKPTRFRKYHAWADKTEIHFMGVFDTVGTLGCPVSFWGLLDNDAHVFHDSEPSSIVKTARHAVALDELRADYEAVLWDPKDGIDLRQVWFSGCHSDVGGGYDDDHTLADIALLWMMNESVQKGLKIDSHMLPKVSSAKTKKAKAHNEYKKLWRLRGAEKREPHLGSLFHESIKTRYKTKPSKGFKRYLKEHGLTINQVNFVS